MKHLSSYIFQQKISYLLAILSLLISVSLDLLSPQFTRHIIDDVVIGKNMDVLTPCLLGILLVGIGRFLFQYSKEYLFDAASSKIALQLRTDLFAHVQSLSVDFFDKNNTGELMARIKDDVDKIWAALGYVSMLILEVIYHTVVVLICMFQIHPKLSILPAIAIPAAGILAVGMERKLDSIYGAISDENTLLNTVAEENLAGVRTVKAFAREKHEIKKFFSHNQRYYELNMQQSRVFVRYYPFFQFITKLLPIAVVLLGGYFVVKDSMTLGDLSAFAQYAANIVWPMEMIGWLTNDISSALASYKKLKEIFRQTPQLSAEHTENPSHKKAAGDICFSHVSFSGTAHVSQKEPTEAAHAPARQCVPILRDISFHIEPGKTIGIMGASGSGKTTLINLLERFYDTDTGTIFLDGKDIRSLSLKELRSNISIVSQDVFLFSDTITENIILGKKNEITSSLLHTSAEQAQAAGFIERMEQGYETIIGERGVGLSGGQKQRISLARALAKQTPVLVLDDATSALDMETEKKIQKILLENDATKIIIAHRISSVRHADEIIILNDGEIAERGTHEELLEKKGYYYRTYLLQYGNAPAPDTVFDNKKTLPAM